MTTKKQLFSTVIRVGEFNQLIKNHATINQNIKEGKLKSCFLIVDAGVGPASAFGYPLEVWVPVDQTNLLAKTTATYDCTMSDLLLRRFSIRHLHPYAALRMHINGDTIGYLVPAPLILKDKRKQQSNVVRSAIAKLYSA